MRMLFGTFSVPIEASQRVIERAKPDYIRKFVEAMEKQGWRLCSQVVISRGLADLTEPGRKRYRLGALFEREPKAIKLDVPDILVPALLEKNKGFKLIE